MIHRTEPERASHEAAGWGNRIAVALENIGKELAAIRPLLEASLARDNANAEELGLAPAAREPGQPNPDAWKEWHGGFCPVKNDAPVWVRLKDGRIYHALASEIQWRRFTGANYVVAWQLYLIKGD